MGLPRNKGLVVNKRSRAHKQWKRFVRNTDSLQNAIRDKYKGRYSGSEEHSPEETFARYFVESMDVAFSSPVM